VRQTIDTVLLSVIGCVNKTVFSASRGRVVLYRFRGRPCLRLTVTGPDAPLGQPLVAGYLPDGDDYVVLAAETEVGLPAALRTATAATAGVTRQQVPVDITMLTDDTDRATLLNRLLKRASIDERHAVTRRREVPIARLTPHYKPADTSRSFVSIRRP
jgi:hypothetical protein